MEVTYYGNIIEGIFWVFVSLVFFVPACKRQEKHRWFCLFGTGVFLVFGLSDFYEAGTGTWWKPWWLLCWKIGCNIGVGLIIFWYVRINGSVSAAISTFKNRKK